MTRDELKQHVDYNADTGRFLRVGKESKRIGCIVKIHGTMYMEIRIRGKLYFAHRLAWLLYHGNWPKCEIDHIDGDGLNNRISNLRDVTRLVNSRNAHRRHPTKNNLPPGVSKTKGGRYTARICVNAKTKHLGVFDDAASASAKYRQAKCELHGVDISKILEGAET